MYLFACLWKKIHPEIARSTTTVATHRLTTITVIFRLLSLFHAVESIMIFAVVSSFDANRAPPVALWSATQVTLSGIPHSSLAIFSVIESFHWPSFMNNFPDDGHIRSILRLESLWYRDHCTVILPMEPLERRRGISSSVTVCARLTLIPLSES